MKPGNGITLPSIQPKDLLKLVNKSVNSNNLELLLFALKRI